MKQQGVNKKTMRKKSLKRNQTDELRSEYDQAHLKAGIRGKYLAGYRAGTNVVLLSPDVAEYFPDARSVNAALRNLIANRKRQLRGTR